MTKGTHVAENGMTTTPSGLQYRVVTQGTGKKPAASETWASYPSVLTGSRASEMRVVTSVNAPLTERPSSSAATVASFAVGARPSAVMGPIASRLNDKDMQAVVEYISALR